MPQFYYAAMDNLRYWLEWTGHFLVRKRWTLGVEKRFGSEELGLVGLRSEVEVEGLGPEGLGSGEWGSMGLGLVGLRSGLGVGGS